MKIEINCDAGEGVLWENQPVEAALWPWVSSFSLACGGHAGEAETLRPLLDRAARTGKAMGAHPSFPDRLHFGRRSLPMPATALQETLEQQLMFLRGLADAAGVRLAHVKAHGALYHEAMLRPETAALLVAAVKTCCADTPLLGLPGSALAAAAGAAGLGFRVEGFADRALLASGALAPRTVPGAVLSDPEEIVDRCVTLVREGWVRSLEGQWIELRPDTLCLHGDGSNALRLARALHEGLTAAGVEVR